MINPSGIAFIGSVFFGMLAAGVGVGGHSGMTALLFRFEIN